MDADDELPALKARIVARLRAGAVLWHADKEVRWELRAEGRGFVHELHDQLRIGGPPEARHVLATEDALLDWLRPSPDTTEGWQALLRRIDGPPDVPLADADLEGLVVFGAVPDGPPWVAFADGRVDRWLAGAVRPHLRVRIELGEDGHGPFCWRIPLPSSAPAGAAAWLEGAVNGRLVERLAWARLVDLSAPMPIDGGTWSARHADRYETEGMGFVVTAVLHDGRAVTQPVDLARPGTDDPAREVPAARTRLRKGLLRALRG